MKFFAGTQQPSPSITPGDTVVSVDSWVQEIGFNVELLFRFDDVLDPAKLATSLERLMKIGNWHQLGARVRLKVSLKTRKSREGKMDLIY